MQMRVSREPLLPWYKISEVTCFLRLDVLQESKTGEQGDVHLVVRSTNAPLPTTVGIARDGSESRPLRYLSRPVRIVQQPELAGNAGKPNVSRPHCSRTGQRG